MSGAEGELPRKRLRVASADDSDIAQQGGASLNDTLRKILMCIICLELPHPNAVFQCNVGHVMCEVCVLRLMADAVIARREALCPHCRRKISWSGLKQNLALEQTLWELTKTCPDCDMGVKYKFLKDHQENDCPKRLVHCQFHIMGCTWSGPIDDLAEHGVSCNFPGMTPFEMLEALREFYLREAMNDDDEHRCFQELSAHRINYQDTIMRTVEQAQIRPNALIRLRSDPVEMYGNTWQFYLRLECHGGERRFTYKLKMLEDPRRTEQSVKYFIALLSKDINDKPLTDLRCVVNEHTYTQAGETDAFKILPISGSIAIYRLIAMPEIKLRLWMTCSAC